MTMITMQARHAIPIVLLLGLPSTPEPPVRGWAEARTRAPVEGSTRARESGTTQEIACRFRGAADALAERPSPPDSVRIVLGDAEAKLCYSRPSARGRTVIGGVDPYGSPWRFGANEPTTIHLPFAATIGNVDVPAGTYTLYAIPRRGPWTIVVNDNANRWGIPLSPAVRQSDVGSFEVSTSSLTEPVETMTLRFESRGRSGDLIYEWEDTTLRVPISRR